MIGDLVLFKLDRGNNIGELRPAVVVHDWTNSQNLAVLVDGINDDLGGMVYWATSRTEGPGLGQWQRPGGSTQDLPIDVSLTHLQEQPEGKGPAAVAPQPQAAGVGNGATTDPDPNVQQGPATAASPLPPAQEESAAGYPGSQPGDAEPPRTAQPAAELTTTNAAVPPAATQSNGLADCSQELSPSTPIVTDAVTDTQRVPGAAGGETQQSPPQPGDPAWRGAP